MKIEVGDDFGIILKEVFSGLGLVTESGEEFGICMRDSGFEFNYGGYWYEAKEGKLTLLGPDKEALGDEGSFEETTEGFGSFDLDKLYNQKDLCIYGDHLWRFAGKVWQNCPGHGYASFPYIQKKSIGMYPAEEFGWRKLEKRM